MFPKDIGFGFVESDSGRVAFDGDRLDAQVVDAPHRVQHHLGMSNALTSNLTDSRCGGDIENASSLVKAQDA